MAARGWWLAAGGFVAGLALAVVLLAPSLFLDAASPETRIVVAVSNIGTRETVVRITATEVDGGEAVGAWSIVADAGREATAQLGAHRASLVLMLDARWQDVGDSGQGSFRAIVDPAPCRGGSMRASYELDTTRGVAFRPTGTTCAP